jgi:CheY-like chemotaxis protein
MPKSLLVADDSLTIRKVIGMIFATEDFQITSVDNGLEAISKARELHPDLVLADVTMPGRSGYEVCEAIKSDPSTHAVPVLLLAGTFEPFDENRARAAKADDYIIKPFESQALLDKVRTLTGVPRPPEVPRQVFVPESAHAGAKPPASSPFANPSAPPRPSAPAYSIGQGVPRPAPMPAAPVRPNAPVSLPSFGRAASPAPIPMPQYRAQPSPMPRPAVGSIAASAPAASPPTAMQYRMPPTAPQPMRAGPSMQPQPSYARPSPGAIPHAPHPGTPGVPRPDAFGGPPFRPQPQYGSPAAGHEPAHHGEPAPAAYHAPPHSARAPAPSRTDGGEAYLREALSKASREVIEKVVWEVVPQLAEAIIREHLDQLVKERERR